MATALASNLRHSSFADVKIICADGSAWAHRLVLAAVSPVLRHVLICSTISSCYQSIQLGEICTQIKDLVFLVKKSVCKS